MAWDRIRWYEDRNLSSLTTWFKGVRAQHLPFWLREECEPEPVERKFKATRFIETGVPYRAEYFLEEFQHG